MPRPYTRLAGTAVPGHLPARLRNYPRRSCLPQGLDSLFAAAMALSSLADNRQFAEGAKLAAMINERRQTGRRLPRRSRRPEARACLRSCSSSATASLARIRELAIDADEGRLEQELVIQAQKADVDEELDRLEAHIEEVTRTLDKGGPVAAAWTS